MQGMVPGKRSRGKPSRDGRNTSQIRLSPCQQQSSRAAEDRHQFRRDIWADKRRPDEDMFREEEVYIFIYLAIPSGDLLDPISF